MKVSELVKANFGDKFTISNDYKDLMKNVYKHNILTSEYANCEVDCFMCNPRELEEIIIIIKEGE